MNTPSSGSSRSTRHGRRGGAASAVLGFVVAFPLASLALGSPPDVVTTDLDSLQVFEGDGAAGFAPPNRLFIESCAGECVEPWNVAVGDVNGDGIDDIVSANRYGPHVSVHVSRGDGTFEPARIVPTADRPYDVDLGDLDGDGDTDLVVTCNNDAGPVEIRLNDGDGAFPDVVPLSASGEPFNSLLVDVNGDGALDLLFTRNAADETAVFLNTGDGFEFHTFVFVGNDPKAIKAGFFNDDDVPDIVVTNDDAGEVSVYIGDGSGDFTFSRAYATGGEPREVVAVDLDIDGFDDLVVATGRNTEHVAVLLNQGRGGNGAFGGPFFHATGPRPNSVDAGDFNDDGFPDVVVANWSLDDPPLATMSLLVGDGEGGFVSKTDFAPAGGFQKLTALAVGQFNRQAFEFSRADANGDGSHNIADPVAVLRYLFSGGELDCLDAADANDTGTVDVTDGVYILNWLFRQGPKPLPPFPEKGADPTPDELPCDA